MKRHPLPAEAVQALKAADRTPGWNARSRDVIRFDLASPSGTSGTSCVLYVVPFVRWAYRRRERMAAEWRDATG